MNLSGAIQRQVSAEAALIVGEHERPKPMTLSGIMRQAERVDDALPTEPRDTYSFLVRSGLTAESAGRALRSMARRHRDVVSHPVGWSVTHSDFVTIDETLARCVADEFDRIDPLPSYKYGGPVNGPRDWRP